ncbi:MAG TPA: hypothetical protein VGG74_17370 [Kofleriaceae bacterium]
MALLFGVTLFGCAKNEPDYIAGFDPPAQPDGYTRYVTPVVKDIMPGDDLEYCQWVAAPSNEAQDVVAFTGLQSATGHHAVLYSTSETSFPVGESHLCTTQDMLSIDFIGGVGAEGNGDTTLPDGLYFRLPAGEALMANTHWLNTTDKVSEGQAVLDVEYTPALDSHTVADIFANNGDTFSIPPLAPLSYDVSCTMTQDVNLAMVANHMHTDGTSAYTEVLHTDGTTEPLVVDTSWSSDQQFNPNWVRYSEAAPKVLHAGDTVHTHCEWQNQTSNALMFPDEMCVGTGFYFPSNGALECDDGTW